MGWDGIEWDGVETPLSLFCRARRAWHGHGLWHSGPAAALPGLDRSEPFKGSN